MSEITADSIYNQLHTKWCNIVITGFLAMILGAVSSLIYFHYNKSVLDIIPTKPMINNLVGITITIIVFIISLTPIFSIDFLNWCENKIENPNDEFSSIKQGFGRYIYTYNNFCFLILKYELLFLLLTFIDYILIDLILAFINILLIYIILSGFEPLLEFIFRRYKLP